MRYGLFSSIPLLAILLNVSSCAGQREIVALGCFAVLGSDSAQAVKVIENEYGGRFDSVEYLAHYTVVHFTSDFANVKAPGDFRLVIAAHRDSAAYWSVDPTKIGRSAQQLFGSIVDTVSRLLGPSNGLLQAIRVWRPNGLRVDVSSLGEGDVRMRARFDGDDIFNRLLGEYLDFHDSLRSRSPSQQ